MPFLKLKFRPGINRDQTNYSNEGGWFECDKIRFYSGYPQKMGGWIKATSETFLGTCRQMWNWVTSYADNFLAVGTNSKAYIEVGGYYYDITPIRESFSAFVGTGEISGTTLTVTSAHSGALLNGVSIVGSGIASGTQVTAFLTGDGGVGTYQVSPSQTAASTAIETSPNIEDCVSTTTASPVATFAITSHGCITGDYVTISGVSGDVGGIPDAELNAEHVVTVLNDNSFTVTVSTAATTAATGGGTSIKVTCQIHPGFPAPTEGYGWGTDAWNGDFGWGLATNVPIYLPQQDWFFDNFENDLVMNIRAIVSGAGFRIGGPIYYWSRGTNSTPISALATPAVALSSLSGAADVPESATQILVSQNDKHLLAFGCQPYAGAAGEFDPLLIRWASQDDPQFWTPTTGLAPRGLPSTAGFIRVSRGSRIVRAIPTRQEIAVFTDTHLYTLQYLGTTEVFGLQELADNISIMGPRTVAVANNIVYWMGLDKFYAYDGRVQTLPCTLRQFVFEDINLSLANSVVTGNNERFNEIWWFYASGTSTWNNRYVVYNYAENIWYYGNLGRTAWLDAASRSVPVAMYTDEDQNPGQAYLHETGIDDDTGPMVSYIQSSDFDITQGSGEKFMLSRRVIPDVNFISSTAETPQVTLEVRSRNFPGSRFQNDPSDAKNIVSTTVDNYTDQVFIRARGRQMALKIASDTTGVQWQLGDPRLDVRPDGRR